MPITKNLFGTARHGRTMSFPSSFNRGGNHLQVQGISDVIDIFKYSTARSTAQKNDKRGARNGVASTLERIASRNFGGYEDNTYLYNILYNEETVNGANYQGRPLFDNNIDGFKNKLDYPSESLSDRDHKWENPFHFPTAILRSMNTYRYINKVKTVARLFSYKTIDEQTKKEKLNHVTAELPTTLSMFNPHYNVQSIGLAPNVPLLLDGDRNKMYGPIPLDSNLEDLSDCSIRTLVKLSNRGEFGPAVYRYADFMYCKDLGKVANNYLITLRKFPFEVGDQVAQAAKLQLAKKDQSDLSYDPGPEEGHLVAWFGTEDNKLEDILKYSYQYTWKELKAERQDLDSKEDSPDRGIIGMISNFNPSYNKGLGAGTSGQHNILSKIARHVGVNTGMNAPNSDALLRLTKFDQNKVYTPLQTIQDMYIPEGQLKFQHEFNLTFSYKLRAYENINPKSAFLDLLNNILKVTYYDGRFWGGESRIIGPKPNYSAYRKANAMIDGAFKLMGGVMQALASGSTDTSEALGTVSNNIQNGIQEGLTNITNITKSVIENPRNAIGMISSLAKGTGLSAGLKGLLKNRLGRPSFYAFNSLLSGDDTGCWHVTIGNPRNPIVSFGNLIMTNATLQQGGPLGIDDFPTELKVTVTMKHARSRDAAAIGRMYTMGIAPLSFHQQNNKESAYIAISGVMDSLEEKNDDAPNNGNATDNGNAQAPQGQSQGNNAGEKTDEAAAAAFLAKEKEQLAAYEKNVDNFNQTYLTAQNLNDPHYGEYLSNPGFWAMYKNGSLNMAAVMTSFDEVAAMG